MARARNIKPSLFKNEVLGEADPLLTILFTGLWCLADKEGRLEDRPKRIRVEIFPYRDGVEIEDMLLWLEEHSFITRYQIVNESYISVCKFHEHQKPHHMESESVIPPPPGNTNKFRAKPIYKHQRERILAAFDHKCCHCKSAKNLQIDHIHPVALGGTSDDENLQVLCASCNASKGKKIVTNSGRIVNESSEAPKGALIPDSLNPNTRADKSAYVFEGETIKLNQSDYEDCLTKYPNLDLDYHLGQLDSELRGTKKWFSPMHSKLNYRNNTPTHQRQHSGELIY